MAHGAPTSVDDIPLYLKNIRGGTDSSPEVIQIIRDRYEAIGGSSPLLEITKGQAEELEKFLNQNGGNFKVYIGMRNWAPYISVFLINKFKFKFKKPDDIAVFSTAFSERFINAHTAHLSCKTLDGFVTGEVSHFKEAFQAVT